MFFIFLYFFSSTISISPSIKIFTVPFVSQSDAGEAKIFSRFINKDRGRFSSIINKRPIVSRLFFPSRRAFGFYDNMCKLIPAVRTARIQVFIVPHHRWREGGYKGWKHMNPSQIRSNESQSFAAGTWGGEFHPEFGPREGDVIVLEHWAQSGFANTDLDAQLKQRGIQKIILVVMIANTCIEATDRLGMELGYHVSLIKDATAALNHEGMHAIVFLSTV